jgi:hypothetical protein
MKTIIKAFTLPDHTDGSLGAAVLTESVIFFTNPSLKRAASLIIIYINILAAILHIVFVAARGILHLLVINFHTETLN